MARQYFNGVSKLSFNGNLFSFELEDKYRTGNGEEISEKITTVTSELDNAEQILKFLLSEIEKIKKIRDDQKNSDKDIKVKKNDIETQSSKHKLGQKIKMSNFEHN